MEIDGLKINDKKFEYLFVFKSVIAGNDRPTMQLLNRAKRNEATEVVVKWKELGIELLGGSTHRLNVIKRDHHDSQDECCTAMFQEWLDVNPNASWNELIKALENIGLVTAASNIKVMIGTVKTGKIYIATSVIY